MGEELQFDAVWGNLPLKPNTELCFCCTVPQSDACKILLIAKDYYNLYVNGRFVCYGPARAAKGYCRVDEIDLSAFLTRPQNTVCVYVLSVLAGTLSFCLENPLFAAIIKTEKLTVRTGDFQCYEMTDRIRKIDRMSRQRGFCEVYDCKVPREQNDFSVYRALSVCSVPTPKLLKRRVAFSDNTVYPFTERYSGMVSSRQNEVTERHFARMEDLGAKFGGYARKDCDVLLGRELLSFDYTNSAASVCWYKIFESAITHCGKLKIAVKVNEPITLWVIYDDLLTAGIVRFDREHIIHGLKWRLQPGSYTLYSSEVYSAKYIQTVFDRPVERVEVSIIGIENSACKSLLLPPMNKRLQKTVAASQNSFRHNAYDILTDCPSRERAGWLCDGYFIGKAEQFFTGENKVEKNLLENFLLYENEYFPDNGMIPMCYPSHITDKNENIPAWTLWYILELADYYHRTGDGEFLALHTKRLWDILSYFSAYENEYGLLENLEGWVFLEWSKASDFTDGVNIPHNILYTAALAAAGDLLQREDLVLKSEKLRETIIEKAFNGTVFADQFVRQDGHLVQVGSVSELCQIYAAYFRLIPQNAAFRQNFVTRFRNTPYDKKLCPTAMFIGEVLRIMTLYDFGEYALLLSECEVLFAPMAERTGTLWEFFDENAGCNHGFGAALGMLICKAAQKINERTENNETAL